MGDKMQRECPNCGYSRECESDIEKNFIKLILENNELTRKIELLEGRRDANETNKKR